MLYGKQDFILKDSKVYTFVTPGLSDASTSLAFISRVARQTPYLSRCELDPYGEVDDQRKWIENHRNSDDSYLIFVYDNGKQVASADIKFHKLAKEKHTAEVGIVIDYCYWDRGIGSQLFYEFFRLAREHGVELITLWMVYSNDRARHLYMKYGFKQFGTLPDGHKYNGKYYDLAYMVARVDDFFNKYKSPNKWF